MQHLWILTPIALGVCLGKNVWLFSSFRPLFDLLQRFMILSLEDAINIICFSFSGVVSVTAGSLIVLFDNLVTDE